MKKKKSGGNDLKTCPRQKSVCVLGSGGKREKDTELGTSRKKQATVLSNLKNTTTKQQSLTQLNKEDVHRKIMLTMYACMFAYNEAHKLYMLYSFQTISDADE